MYRDRKGLCRNTGLGSEKSILPSACTECAFPPGKISASLPAASLHLYWGCLGPSLALLQTWKGTLAKAFCLLLCLQSWTPWCPPPHPPLLLTLPILFPSFGTAGTISVFVLADSFFQHTPEMGFVPSGPNSIMFCQNLVLKITASENYQSAQSSRKTQLSSQEGSLSFPFSSKYLKCFTLSKWI